MTRFYKVGPCNRETPARPQLLAKAGDMVEVNADKGIVKIIKRAGA